MGLSSIFNRTDRAQEQYMAQQNYLARMADALAGADGAAGQDQSYDTGSQAPAAQTPAAQTPAAQTPAVPAFKAIDTTIQPSGTRAPAPQAVETINVAPSGLIAAANPALTQSPEMLNLGRPQVVINGQYR